MEEGEAAEELPWRRKAPPLPSSVTWPSWPRVHGARRPRLAGPIRPPAAPPVLHRKESFLHPEHELYKKLVRLTKQEEKAGLLEETATIGMRDGWSARLTENSYGLRGHRLVKANMNGLRSREP